MRKQLRIGQRPWVVVAAVAVLAIVLLGAWLTRGGLVRRLAEEQLERRLGMVASVEAARLGVGVVRLRGVHLGGGEGGLEVELDNVTASVRPLGLLLGRGGVSGVELSGVRVVIDPAHPGARGSLLSLRAAVRRRFGGMGRGSGTAARAAGGRALLLRLEEGSVRSPGSDGARMLLDHLHARLERLDGGRLRFQGGGVPEDGGALDWDITAIPRELRAEGTVTFRGLPGTLLDALLPEVPWHEPERARLDGELRVAPDAEKRVHLEGRASLRDAAVYSERIAPGPVRDLGFEIDGAGTWTPAERRLDLAGARLRVGRATLELAGGFLVRDGRIALDGTVVLPPTRCTDAVGAIPTDLLGELHSFTWRGTLAGRLKAHIDTAAPESTEVTIDLNERCAFEGVPAVASLERVEGTFLHRVHEPDGRVFQMTTGPGSESWTPISEVSPFLIHAVLAHEDPSFFSHAGFAPWAIEEAIKRNLEERRFAWGASTISMQLAKNLFLERTKTLDRKVKEVLLTWWLESALSKRDILELYLNVIELGEGVYGVRNGARHYFGRAPAELSPAEAVFLATILPAPKVYGRAREAGRVSAGVAGRARFLLEHMTRQGRIDEVALAAGLEELEALEFADGSGATAARPVVGWAAPLPFPTGPGAWDAWPWPPDGGVPAVPASRP